MVFERDRSIIRDIVLSGNPVKLENNFRYLGSAISADGRINEEMPMRLQKGG